MKAVAIIAMCLLVGCDTPEFASVEEYQSAGWYTPAVACKNENGVMVCWWSDGEYRYKSNTVTGVVLKMRRYE